LVWGDGVKVLRYSHRKLQPFNKQKVCNRRKSIFLFVANTTQIADLKTTKKGYLNIMGILRQQMVTSIYKQLIRKP
jgi:hypothetical protein